MSTGTVYTSGGTEQRRVRAALRERRRFKASTWGQLREKMDLSGVVGTDVFVSIIKAEAKRGTVRLQIQPGGTICVFTDL